MLVLAVNIWDVDVLAVNRPLSLYSVKIASSAGVKNGLLIHSPLVSYTRSPCVSRWGAPEQRDTPP